MEIGRDQLDTQARGRRGGLIDDAIDELHEEEVYEQIEPITDSSWRVEAATVTTAAALAGEVNPRPLALRATASRRMCFASAWR